MSRDESDGEEQSRRRFVPPEVIDDAVQQPTHSKGLHCVVATTQSIKCGLLRLRHKKIRAAGEGKEARSNRRRHLLPPDVCDCRHLHDVGKLLHDDPKAGQEHDAH